MTIIKAMGLDLFQPVTLMPGIGSITLDSDNCLAEFVTDDGAVFSHFVRVKIQIFPTSADLQDMELKRHAALAMKGKTE